MLKNRFLFPIHMRKEIMEGKTSFLTDSEEKISKEMAVFYNPVMKFNRDMTLLVLASMDTPEEKMRIGLPLEASGIRAARIFRELVTPGHLRPSFLAVNDLSEDAIGFAKENVAKHLGDFSSENVAFSINEASRFLLGSRPFHYIDIDPFGTPNPFLDAAVKRILPRGILAVTATDTSALAGTYPKATARKYWAVPSRTWAMHDIGLRILIRKVQMIAAQHEVPLTPVLSLATDHYYRIFFLHMPSAKNVASILSQHRWVNVDQKTTTISIAQEMGNAGPLWVGPLHDPEFVKRLIASAKRIDPETFSECLAVLETVLDECRIDVVGFTDIHALTKRLRLSPPKTSVFLEKLGIRACRTHICATGIKTTASIEEIESLLR